MCLLTLGSRFVTGPSLAPGRDRGLHKPELQDFGVKQEVQGGIWGRWFGQAVPSQCLSQWGKEVRNMWPGV